MKEEKLTSVKVIDELYKKFREKSLKRLQKRKRKRFYYYQMT